MFQSDSRFLGMDGFEFFLISKLSIFLIGHRTYVKDREKDKREEYYLQNFYLKSMVCDWERKFIVEKMKIF